MWEWEGDKLSTLMSLSLKTLTPANRSLRKHSRTHSSFIWTQWLLEWGIPASNALFQLKISVMQDTSMISSTLSARSCLPSLQALRFTKVKYQIGMLDGKWYLIAVMIVPLSKETRRMKIISQHQDTINPITIFGTTLWTKWNIMTSILEWRKKMWL